MLTQLFSTISPTSSVLIILNLVVIESLLSIDNAAVLATMVLDLPQQQRKKALRYGVLGAYLFRGICLFFAAWLIKIWWLKSLGGLYLLFLFFNYLRSPSNTNQEQNSQLAKEENKLLKYAYRSFGQFWSTVILVEFMDLAFSIDNVFAAVAFTDNIYLIWIGVFIGILAMRFVAQGFIVLMERYRFLESSAFIVIGILGGKLLLSLPVHFYPNLKFLESEQFDLITSAITVCIFAVPILTSRFFNFPKH